MAEPIEDVRHFYIGVDRSALKSTVLVDLVNALRVERNVNIAVCCCFRDTLDSVAGALRAGDSADEAQACCVLHTDLAPPERKAAIDAARRGGGAVLVAMDSVLPGSAEAPLLSMHVIIGVELPRAASGYAERLAALCSSTAHRPAAQHSTAYDTGTRARACVVSILAPHEVEAFRAQQAEQSSSNLDELHSARELLETLKLS